MNIINEPDTKKAVNMDQEAIPMNDLVKFTYDGRKVRTFVEDEEPLWVGKDTAEALGYERFDSHLLDKVPGEWKGTKPIRTPGGIQNMLCLSEQGLYFFLGRSDRPAALPFQKWIAGEVLPAIRKTGTYSLLKQEYKSLLNVHRQNENYRIKYIDLLDELERVKPSWWKSFWRDARKKQEKGLD